MHTSSLAHFEDYKTTCLYTEPLELLRRMFLIGVVSFCGERGETQSFIAALVALLSIFMYREAQPFNDRLTNMLANVAMWMCYVTFLSAFIIQSRPFGYDDNVRDLPCPQSCGHCVLFKGRLCLVMSPHDSTRRCSGGCSSPFSWSSCRLPRTARWLITLNRLR